jgi:hypothetical protein
MVFAVLRVVNIPPHRDIAQSQVEFILLQKDVAQLRVGIIHKRMGRVQPQVMHTLMVMVIL